LRWNHTAVHPRVYLPNDAEQTLYVSTVAAWLWTGRRGVIAGRAAAALHGAKWVDPPTPVAVIAEHTRRRDGVAVHEERIAPDEITHVGELPTSAWSTNTVADSFCTACVKRFRDAGGPPSNSA
jgi:hypothetical protein